MHWHGAAPPRRRAAKALDCWPVCEANPRQVTAMRSMILVLLVHASSVTVAAAVQSGTDSSIYSPSSAPLWGLSATRRSAFRGHGPMSAIDAAAEAVLRANAMKAPPAGECATSGFALERRFDGPVLASVTTANSAEACCDACSLEDECERWLFDQGPALTCHLLSASGTSSPGSRTLVSALRVPASRAKHPPPPPPPEALWFHEQVLDHFVPATRRSHWSQRYYVNDTLWGGPGFPVFLYIGGEGAESGRAISGELFLSHLAEEHQALLVDVEHRFYGESHPTPDMSDQSLELLSSQQALADLAHFVSWFSLSYSSEGTGDSPWVCFGGSYPGDLSAWFRLKFPQHVIGAVASSAPVLAKEDMPEYMDVVGRSLRRDGGDKCWEMVFNATETMAQMLALGPPGEEEVMKHFQACEPMTALNAATFIGDAMGSLQGVVQGNHIYPGGNMTTISIMCGLIESKGANHSLDALMPLLSEPNNRTKCRDNSYDKALKQLQNTSWGKSMDRQWTWQTCNEFGFFQTAGSVESPFHPLSSTLDLQYYRTLCQDAYGLPHAQNFSVPTSFTNSYYGARSLGASRVVLPDGSVDPWHSLALTEPLTPLQAALNLTPVLIDGTTHCGDMYYPQKSDLPSLQAAHAEIATTVASWLPPRPNH